MIPKITFQGWTYGCGEPGCCSDYGTRIIVDGNVIREYAETNSEELRAILTALGVEAEIVDEEEDAE